MVIYIDILIGINIYITYFLLLAAEKLSGQKASLFRKALASFLGGAASLLILLPEIDGLPLLLIKLCLGAIITAAAFGYGNKQRFFKELTWFLAANFLFAGCMIALWLLCKPQGLAIRNGTVYYHISALTLSLSTIAAYIATRFIARLSDKKLPREAFQTASIDIGGSTITAKVFFDSGNQLYSLSGLPVVICNRELLRPALPEEVLQAAADPLSLASLKGSWKRKTEVIPCGSVGGEKLLCAIRPDRFRFENGPDIPCLLALSEERFCGGEADAIAGEPVFKNR